MFEVGFVTLIVCVPVYSFVFCVFLFCCWFVLFVGLMMLDGICVFEFVLGELNSFGMLKMSS